MQGKASFCFFNGSFDLRELLLRAVMNINKYFVQVVQFGLFNCAKYTRIYSTYGVNLIRRKIT